MRAELAAHLLTERYT